MQDPDRMRVSLIPLGFDGMSAEAQLRALQLLFCCCHLAMTFRPGSVLPPPGWCPLGAHVFFAGHGDPKPTGWAESVATGGGIYGYAHDAPSVATGGTTHHLWCEPCAPDHTSTRVSPRRRSALKSARSPQDKSPNPSAPKSSRLGGEGAGQPAGPPQGEVQKRLNF